MLPDPDHFPPGLLQPRVRIGVSALILLELLAPELGVGLRSGTVDGAAVPEAAIDEYGDARRPEDNIDLPATARHDTAMEPEPEA